MIITIQGTKYGNNGAAKLAGALSFLGVMKDQRSSLILQFMDKTRHNAENYLIGASLRNESFVQDVSITDISAGMDALFAHSGGQLTKALFNETTRKLTASNMKNFYDVAFSTNKESFEKELLEKNRKSKEDDHDFIESFLKAADKAYKDVYVIVDSKNKQLSDQVTRWSEVNLIMVPQGRKEPFVKGPGRNMAVVNDYCSGSMYNAKSLMKEYDSKIIYALMHNIAFNDACAEGTLLSFLQQNLGARPGDMNYEFMHNLEIIYDSVVRNTKRKVEDIDPDRTVYAYKGQKYIDMPWRSIDENVLFRIVSPEDYIPIEPLSAKKSDDDETSYNEISNTIPDLPDDPSSSAEEVWNKTAIEDTAVTEGMDDIKPEETDTDTNKEDKKMKKRGGLFAAFSRKPRNTNTDINLPEDDGWDTPVEDNYNNDEYVSDDQDTESDEEEIELIEVPQDIPEIDDVEAVMTTEKMQDIPPVAVRPAPGENVMSSLPEKGISETEEIETEMVKPEIADEKPVTEEPAAEIPEIPDIPDIPDIPEPVEVSQEPTEQIADNTEPVKENPEKVPETEDIQEPAETDLPEQNEDEQPKSEISEAERLNMLIPDTGDKPVNDKPVNNEPVKQAPAITKPMTEEERLSALLNGI